MRGKKTDYSDAQCAIARAIGVVGEQWTLLIVRDALRGMRRFGEFQKSLGLAKNILADRLRKLVEAGILEMHPSSEGSSRSDYVITPKGRELSVILLALAGWGSTHAFSTDEPVPVLVDRRDELPARVVVVASDGRELGPDESKLVTPAKAT